jgi:hypothetical protein
MALRLDDKTILKITKTGFELHRILPRWKAAGKPRASVKRKYSTKPQTTVASATPAGLKLCIFVGCFGETLIDLEGCLLHQSNPYLRFSSR